MKKTLIASAVAAAALSTSAFAMDPASELAAKLDSMPTVYGNIQLAYSYEEFEQGSAEVSTNDWVDNGSTLGIKHSHEVAPGLTGFLKAELEFDADENHGDGINKLDEAYIGLKGDFGSVQIGSDDTVYELIDVTDLYEAANDTSSTFGDLAGMDEGNNLQYMSPTIAGGLQVGATISLVNDDSHTGALYAGYNTDMFTVGLAYAAAKGKREDTIGLGATFAVTDELGLQASYETEDDLGDLIALNGVYSMGASQFMLGASFFDGDTAAEVEEVKFTVQALHNLSDNMYVWVEAGVSTAEAKGVADVDGTGLAIGSAYVF